MTEITSTLIPTVHSEWRARYTYRDSKDDKYLWGCTPHTVMYVHDIATGVHYLASNRPPPPPTQLEIFTTKVAEIQ